MAAWIQDSCFVVNFLRQSYLMPCCGTPHILRTYAQGLRIDRLRSTREKEPAFTITIMHELGIMESALTLAQRYAVEKNARRIERVVLRIGALAGVDPEALRFAFDVASRGTVAEGATLEIEPVAAAIFCLSCQKEFVGEDRSFIFTCPDCGDFCGDIRRGRELELSRLEFS